MMKRRPHTVLRYLLLLLFAAACWYLLASALDMAVQELQANVLSTLRATVLLLILAAGTYLLYLPHLRITAVDLFAAALFVVVTIGRLCLSGPGGAVRYDEMLQAVMIYLSLRILFTAEQRMMTLLLILLCGFGIYEGWIGIRQIYGFACSNHGLFKVTGTFFNPGPYAGFIAPVFVCAVAGILRTREAARRMTRSWTALHRQNAGALLWGLGPYLLGWGAAIMTFIILPAAMSRAALVAVSVGCGALAFRELDVRGRFRRTYRANPLRVGILSAVTLLLVAGVAAGAYHIKRPSAEGRLLMWKIDARIMLRHPLRGVGLGNFAGAFGEEQARYFASEERPESETQVAGCPESGFNEFLQFGAETGLVGFVLLLLVTGIAVMDMIRRGSPFGYGLLTAAVFACFSYPWSVLPLRLLFVILLACACPEQTVRFRTGWRHLFFLLLLAGAGAVWQGVYKRYALRVDARREWSEVRIWLNSGRYDYLVEDGGYFFRCLRDDFRFLYDYGYALHKTGDYKKSNEILREGTQISSDPMFWNIIGKNCKAQGNFVAAEEAYLHAHYMIPDRVYPLYLLARLYIAAGQTEKACVTICTVVNHRPKVESVQTREMQAELRHTLDSLKKTDRNAENR